MGGFLFWPYDEVALESGEEPHSIIVKTPWIQAKVNLPEEYQEKGATLLAKFQAGEVTLKDIEIVNWFFCNFDSYPLSYILATPKSGDVHRVQGNDFSGATIETVISSVSKDDVETVSKVLANLPRKAFVWDSEAALTFSKVGNEIHPESLFTIVRRYHLLELLENDIGKEVFKFIENLPREDFAQAVSRIVKQNLYVTEKCNSSLAPAVQIAQSARALVEHFIQQEKGHDRLLTTALKSIVEKPEEVPVSIQTITLMNLLKLTAERNFLAFAMAVDFFERSSYEKMDPLALLLLKGGFDEAAKQINRHMDINDAGGHENMGLKFLESMAPCSREYAQEALYLAEAVSLVMNSVTASAV